MDVLLFYQRVIDIAEYTQHIINNLLQFKEYLAMRKVSTSPIVQHNRYKQTDVLYDPLRDVLRKSSVEKKKVTGSAVTYNEELNGSVVSRRIREISPEQAEHMQKQILIPTNRRLRPTGDHQVIQGKRFVAVDVTEKYNRPLTQEEFHRLYKQGGVSEKIYEISSQSDKASPKQTPTDRDEKAYTYQTNSSKIPIKDINNREQTDSQAKDRITQTIQLHKSKNKGVNQGVVSGQEYYFETGSKDTAPEVIFNADGFNKNKTSGIRNTLVESRLNEGSDRDAGSGQRRQSREQQLKLRKGASHGSQKDSLDFNRIIGVSGGNGAFEGQQDQYRFRSGTYATGAKQSQKSNNQGISINKKKSPYKYNLFSAVDQGVNSKCSSFGKNQLVAREINNKKW